MAENVLSNAARGIINSVAGTLAAKETRLFWGVEEELEKLKRTVSTIEDMLLDAQQEQGKSHEVSNWLGKLTNILYEADDFLDAVSAKALRQKILTQDKKAKEVRILSNQLTFSLKMVLKIKKIRGKLDAIAAERKFPLEVRHVETRVASSDSYFRLGEEEAIGREDDKKAVIERLNAKVKGNVSILAIVGSGGLGKTTLAQLIFNDEKFTEKFELKMWVHVSDDFDFKIMVEKLLQSATKHGPKTNVVDTLVDQLRKEIHEKKYLLVLDNVSNEVHEKWSELKNQLMYGGRGSKILLTTRKENVAEIMDVEPYKLDGLNAYASWTLFKQRAFGNGQEPENSSKVRIGKEILTKCGGVPLAVRTVGRMLYMKASEGEWMALKDEEFAKFPQNCEIDILPILKLSYDQLPCQLRNCFAYCSLFPKDYRFDKLTLINLWIAQGFVELQENQCLEDVGNEYFLNLVFGSFFQDVEIDDFGDIISCKMHDLMHDLAITMAGSLVDIVGDNKRNNNEKARHIAFHDDKGVSSIKLVSMYKPNMVRTFLCPMLGFLEFKGEINCKAMFSSFKFLRVLDLSHRDLECVPSSINKLKHLRYLDLSSNRRIQQLPKSITRLQNLQALILFDCGSLEKLPRDISKLVNLRYLNLDYCYGLRYMPRGLGQMTNLQMLTVFVADKCSLFKHSGGLNELWGLNNLRGSLHVMGLNNVKGIVSMNLKEKSHLSCVGLNWSSGDDVDDSVDDMSFTGLEFHPNLKELALSNYQGSRLPIRSLSLTSLVSLRMYNCGRCQYLSSLSHLPCLKQLDLCSLEVLQYMSEFHDGNEFSFSSREPIAFFPMLEQLSLHNCPNLKGWWKKESAVEVESDGEIAEITSIKKHCVLPSFPGLSRLDISCCPRLMSMPLCPNLEELWLCSTSPVLVVSLTTSLSKLKQLNLSSIKELETLPEEWWQNLTSLEKLSISDLNKLKFVHPGTQHLTALKHLYIDNCPNLELDTDEDGMQWQGLRSLVSLTFSRLSKLVSLPLGLQHVTTLQNLKILVCESLTTMPEWTHNCKSLEVLEIVGCSHLESLPEGLHELSSLRILTIKWCRILFQRCKREVGEDWPKIAHIPKLVLK